MRSHRPSQGRTAPLLRFLKGLTGTRIRDDRELFGYVARVSTVCVLLAVALDVVNQLVFFVSWETSIRSWIVSAAIALVIAAPVARAIGKAHLELFRAKQVVEDISRTDPLTGLANRRALMDEAHRSEAMLLALVIIDIDRFKRINDTYGHAAGDRVITAVAQMIRAELAELGLVGRLGGEEFALLSSSASPDTLLPKLSALRERVAGTPIIDRDAAVNVTISAGVAGRRAGQSFDSLFREADRALYLAKAAGRNRVVLYSALEDTAAQVMPRQPPALAERG